MCLLKNTNGFVSYYRDFFLCKLQHTFVCELELAGTNIMLTMITPMRLFSFPERSQR